jgi:hypothetical protein
MAASRAGRHQTRKKARVLVDAGVRVAGVRANASVCMCACAVAECGDDAPSGVKCD